jgi:hypothetical protein
MLLLRTISILQTHYVCSIFCKTIYEEWWNYMKRVIVINGPNLNMLGKREPGVYGTETLAKIESKIFKKAEELNIIVEFFQ